MEVRSINRIVWKGVVGLLGSLGLLLTTNPLVAQEKDTNQLSISTYVDAYLSSYTNDLSQQTFQPYSTAGARDNTFGINVAQLGLHYRNNQIRGNFIYHGGDIPQATWSNDFNNIQEANIGVKLSNGLWFDMGFFATHVGTESFLPKNNLLGHPSFITFNEPFYQAGAKLSYDAISNWYFELWLANGYNRHVDNNDAKSIGVLINRSFSANTSLTYTNLYGRESADALNRDQIRFYHNLYLNHHWNDKVFLIIGADLGTQSNSQLQDPRKTAIMYTALFTLRYQFNERFSVTGRTDLSQDEHGFINGVYPVNPTKAEGIDLYGLTFGAEYKPNENSYLRLDGRYTATANGQDIFIENGKATHQRASLMLSVGFYLDQPMLKW